MAIVECEECKKKVSDKAEQCVHCGAPIEKTSPKEIIQGIFGLVFLGFIAFLIWGGDDEPELTSIQKIEYSKKIISKNAELANDGRANLKILEDLQTAYRTMSELKPSEKYKKQLNRFGKFVVRKKEMLSQFSGWNGVHYGLEKLIKSQMNDPDSFDHDSTNIWDMGDHMIVNMKYYGKNSYNAKVKGFVKAKISLDGKTIDIIEKK